MIAVHLQKKIVDFTHPPEVHRKVKSDELVIDNNHVI